MLIEVKGTLKSFWISFLISQLSNRASEHQTHCVEGTSSIFIEHFYRLLQNPSDRDMSTAEESVEPSNGSPD